MSATILVSKRRTLPGGAEVNSTSATVSAVQFDDIHLFYNIASALAHLLALASRTSSQANAVL